MYIVSKYVEVAKEKSNVYIEQVNKNICSTTCMHAYICLCYVLFTFMYTVKFVFIFYLLYALISHIIVYHCFYSNHKIKLMKICCKYQMKQIYLFSAFMLTKHLNSKFNNG